MTEEKPQQGYQSLEGGVNNYSAQLPTATREYYAQLQPECQHVFRLVDQYRRAIGEAKDHPALKEAIQYSAFMALSGMLESLGLADNYRSRAGKQITNKYLQEMKMMNEDELKDYFRKREGGE